MWTREVEFPRCTGHIRSIIIPPHLVYAAIPRLILLQMSYSGKIYLRNSVVFDVKVNLINP